MQTLLALPTIQRVDTPSTGRTRWPLDLHMLIRGLEANDRSLPVQASKEVDDADKGRLRQQRPSSMVSPWTSKVAQAR